MRTLTESIYWMVLDMLCVAVLFHSVPHFTDNGEWWGLAFVALGIISGIWGAVRNYRSAKQAERALRRRTDINITIEHKDDTDRPAPAEQ